MSRDETIKNHKYTPWYEDRDFPEVKAGNDNIVAVVIKKPQRDRLIGEHNVLLEEIQYLNSQVIELKMQVADLEVELFNEKYGE